MPRTFISFAQIQDVSKRKTILPTKAGKETLIVNKQVRQVPKAGTHYITVIRP